MSAKRAVKFPDLSRAGDGYELSPTAKDLCTLPWGDPANREVYSPLDSQRVPKPGAWAMITRKLPAIEGRIDQHFRVGRIFYVEHQAAADDKGFVHDGTYKVICHSPWGDLHLWPYEYSVVDAPTIIDLWTLGEIVFHPTRIDSARFSAVAFYARTRGIGLADAAVMALGTLSGSVGWFEPREDLAEVCEGMEAQVHRHPMEDRL